MIECFGLKTDLGEKYLDSFWNKYKND